MRHLCLIFICCCSAMFCKAQTAAPLAESQLLSKFYAPYALDEQPHEIADTNLIAIWTMQEDVDKHNYFVLERLNYYNYVFTYMNKEGSNRTYENVSASFSKIAGADFLNVGYYDFDNKKSGYFFLKVTDRDSRGWAMTLSLVTDTTLKYINSREALRERIAKHVNDPGFYGRPLHFHKKLPLMYCK